MFAHSSHRRRNHTPACCCRYRSNHHQSRMCSRYSRKYPSRRHRMSREQHNHRPYRDQPERRCHRSSRGYLPDIRCLQRSPMHLEYKLERSPGHQERPPPGKCCCRCCSLRLPEHRTSQGTRLAMSPFRNKHPRPMYRGNRWYSPNQACW